MRYLLAVYPNYNRPLILPLLSATSFVSFKLYIFYQYTDRFKHAKITECFQLLQQAITLMKGIFNICMLICMFP